MVYKPVFFQNSFSFILVTSGIFFMLNACNTTINDVLLPRVNLDIVNEGNLAFSHYLEVVNMGQEGFHIATSDSLTKIRVYDNAFLLNNQCGTVQLDTLENAAYQLILNFGEENCEALNGQQLRGELTVQWENNFSAPGTILNYSFENFHINNLQIEGNISLERQAQNEEGNPVNTLQINGTLLKYKDSTSINFEGNFKREMIAGSNTGKLSDDAYIFTGTASGNSSTGHDFSLEINTPLLQSIETNCFPTFISGNQILIPENAPARNVQYGDGTCDHDAEVVIDDLTYPVRFQR